MASGRRALDLAGKAWTVVRQQAERARTLAWTWLRTRWAWLNTRVHAPQTADASSWELIQQADAARLSWQAAQARFQVVSAPELVDEAIHRVNAAERHYAYLLRLAREMGVRLPSRDAQPWYAAHPQGKPRLPHAGRRVALSRWLGLPPSGHA